MSNLRIPVLPIPATVLFPFTAMPVFIEDHHYIKMIRDCIRDDSVLAVSLAEPTIPVSPFKADQSWSPRSICGAGQPHIIEENLDGSIKILVKGIGKVRLLNLLQNLPYPVFEAEIFPDRPEAAVLNNHYVERLSQTLDEWLIHNIPNSLERENFIKNIKSVQHIVDYLSMFLVQDVTVKQMILESNSLIERIHMVNALLSEYIPFAMDLATVKAFKEFENLEFLAKTGH